MSFRIYHEESQDEIEVSDTFVMLLGFVLSTFENVALGRPEDAFHSNGQARIRFQDLGLDAYYLERTGFSRMLARAGGKVVIQVDQPEIPRLRLEELGDETGG